MHKHTIGIDLSKHIFQVCLVNTSNKPKVISNKQVRRTQLLSYMRNQQPSLVFMEACSGAHFWARQFRAMGHQVKLIAAQFVKPFVKGHKTDANDALAIVEAGLRPNMRFVATKSLEQQDIQSLHRVRSSYIKARTALINRTHSLLQEYGIASGRGQKALKDTLAKFFLTSGLGNWEESLYAMTKKKHKKAPLIDFSGAF